MKSIIVYKGKYGATKQYAEWLGEELNLPVLSAELADEGQLALSDFYIIGSSVYIGKLQIRKWLKKNLSVLKNKKIIFFQVAGTPIGETEKRQAYNLSSIPGELIGQCDFYFLPGRLAKDKLSWFDRFMLKMGSRLTKDAKEKERMLTDYDDVKRDSIREILAVVKGMKSSSGELYKTAVLV